MGLQNEELAAEGQAISLLPHAADQNCEAKLTTLERPSPGDGFENHMYLLKLEPCAK